MKVVTDFTTRRVDEHSDENSITYLILDIKQVVLHGVVMFTLVHENPNGTKSYQGHIYLPNKPVLHVKAYTNDTSHINAYWAFKEALKLNV